MFDAAEHVADAVLYEGYVLYPYRASAVKNQFRWQFGIVAPRSPRDEGEPWFSQTECILDVDHRADRRGPPQPDADAPRVSIRVRFLRPSARSHDADASGSPVWLEGVPHAIDLEPLDLADVPLTREAPIGDPSLDVRVAASASAEDGYIKLRLRLENREPWRAEFGTDRDAMLRRSLVGAHLLLAVDRGCFVSLLEPPDAAAAAVARCENRHTWPVLVGDRSSRRLMLSSPIVLYDFPAVAKESPGDLCDAAEIDEILSLRIMTMTDEEKREARATDPRARDILDRVDALTPDALASLHGTMRSADFFNPPNAAPGEAFVTVGARRVAKGSRVRLRPNRRADAMDMFLRDQAATVAGVYRDVDDRVYVAITVDADPAATLHASFGRYFYFDPSEVEPLDDQDMERI